MKYEIIINYPDVTQEAYDWFKDLCPCGEYGIHTIESVTATPAVTKEQLV